MSTVARGLPQQKRPSSPCSKHWNCPEKWKSMSGMLDIKVISSTSGWSETFQRISPKQKLFQVFGKCYATFATVNSRPLKMNTPNYPGAFSLDDNLGMLACRLLMLVAVLVHMVPRLGLVLPLASDFPLINVRLLRVFLIPTYISWYMKFAPDALIAYGLRQPRKDRCMKGLWYFVMACPYNLCCEEEVQKGF